MLHQKKIIVVMPAYKAEQTLRKTYADIPHGVVDEVLLVDDASTDRTVQLARELGIKAFVHKQNLGYGANQKTCYREALEAGADIVVMLHPDYQYDPKLITAMAATTIRPAISACSVPASTFSIATQEISMGASRRSSISRVN